MKPGICRRCGQVAELVKPTRNCVECYAEMSTMEERLKEDKRAAFECGLRIEEIRSPLLTG